jgi:NAD(P)-dependent dehydrogenase (short-subunit alcohol dehydrogenase family)
MTMTKSILITGAGSGLGRGTAIGLAKAGHRVFATTQIWPQVSDLQREAEKLGLSERLTVDKLDVLDERDVKAAMHLPFDTFVSNAGIGEGGPIAEQPVDLVRKTFETNVFSNLAIAQHVVRKFRDAKMQGRIVFVSSMGGMLTAYGLGAYCASKHALEGIAAALRDELANTGISVQTINPGAYDTGFNDRIGDTTYHWHDDAVHLTKERDIRASFAAIMKGQLDPKDMIDKMVEVIGADEGMYRNVWPPAIETLIKEVQTRAWTLRVGKK